MSEISNVRSVCSTPQYPFIFFIIFSTLCSPIFVLPSVFLLSLASQAVPFWKARPPYSSVYTTSVLTFLFQPADIPHRSVYSQNHDHDQKDDRKEYLCYHSIAV